MPHTAAEKARLPCIPKNYAAWGTLAERLASCECYGVVNLSVNVTYVNTRDRNAFIASHTSLNTGALTLWAAFLVWQRGSRYDSWFSEPGLTILRPDFRV